MTDRFGHATRAMTHPVTVLCLALWLLNDHVLKAQFHNAATGKLSDVAAMVVFPVLVAGLLAPFVAKPMTFSLGFTAAFFAGINVSPGLDSLTERGLGLFVPNVNLTMDPTDLIVLPFLGVANWVWRQAPVDVRRVRRFGGRVLFGVALLTTLATSSEPEHFSPSFKGTVVLDEATPSVLIPYEVRLDGEPDEGKDAELWVYAIGSALGLSESDLDGGDVIKVDVGDDSVELTLADPTLAPVEVSWEISALTTKTEDIDLDVDAPANEFGAAPAHVFDPDVDAEGPQLAVAVERWEISVPTPDTDVRLLATPNGASDTRRIRAATPETELELIWGRATEVPIPESCDVDGCTVELWLRGARFTELELHADEPVRVDVESITLQRTTTEITTDQSFTFKPNEATQFRLELDSGEPDGPIERITTVYGVTIETVEPSAIVSRQSEDSLVSANERATSVLAATECCAWNFDVVTQNADATNNKDPIETNLTATIEVVTISDAEPSFRLVAAR